VGSPDKRGMGNPPRQPAALRAPPPLARRPTQSESRGSFFYKKRQRIRCPTNAWPNQPFKTPVAQPSTTRPGASRPWPITSLLLEIWDVFYRITSTHTNKTQNAKEPTPLSRLQRDKKLNLSPRTISHPMDFLTVKPRSFFGRKRPHIF
jgi:hypothetical protein